MKLLAERVTFSYPSGVQALVDINLEIGAGEAVAIVGANGAGKTTLVRHFNGLLRPSQGQVFVGDWDARRHSVAELASRVAFAFQNPEDQIFKNTVHAEVAFGPRNLGLPEIEVNSNVREALDMVGLLEAADEHPYDLNASERKLVTLAGAVAMNTPVVIFDEPTTGQDSIGIAGIVGMIQSLKQSNRTVIVISHDLDFCVENLEAVVVMQHGRIIQQGPTAEVFANKKLLKQADLDSPQLIRLSQKIGMRQSPTSADVFVRDYVNWKRSKRSPS
jgi:energy-coupling factor transport system ATP-binding protein